MSEIRFKRPPPGKVPILGVAVGQVRIERTVKGGNDL
jgi:hypothetical protein